MANICINTIEFRPKTDRAKKILKDGFDVYLYSIDVKEHKDIMENFWEYFGTIRPERHNYNLWAWLVYCKEEDNGVFRIDVESKWSPCVGMWANIFYNQLQIPEEELEISFTSEEPGLEVYMNDGNIFDEEYKAEDYESSDYFLTKEDAKRFVADSNTDSSIKEKALLALERGDDDFFESVDDENGYRYLGVHKFWHYSIWEMD